MAEPAFIGKSNAFKKLQKEALRLARLEQNVFIEGDEGTGKTTLAAFIHSSSTAAGRLIILDSSLSGEKVMNIFFEKGARQSATILFQDIQRLSFLYQAKLSQFLRNVHQAPFSRIIVTATRSPERLRNEGKLIDALQAHLEKFERVAVPPLRERVEDIPLLVEHFIKRTCESMNIGLKSIDVNILDFLVRREWSGNVAELKSVIESTVFSSADRTIQLPAHLVNEQVQLENIIKNIHQRKAFSFDTSLSNLERTLIEKTLDTVDHNQTRAAEILNLSEANLRYRLRKFHILRGRRK